MKLRLDEYYYIISYSWDSIEDYMPENLLHKVEDFKESHTQSELYDFLESLYSYITVINETYKTIYIDLEKSCIRYQAIVEIDNKYYSFEYYHSHYWDFDDCVDTNTELIEVEPVEVKEIKYKPINK